MINGIEEKEQDNCSKFVILELCSSCWLKYLSRKDYWQIGNKCDNNSAQEYNSSLFSHKAECSMGTNKTDIFKPPSFNIMVPLISISMSFVYLTKPIRIERYWDWLRDISQHTITFYRKFILCWSQEAKQKIPLDIEDQCLETFEDLFKLTTHKK